MTNDEEKDLTIVLPVYDEEMNIEQELQRILRTMDAARYSYEIVIVNDASTDNTRSLAEKFARQYPDKIRIVNHKRNLGVGAARRTGTLAASGRAVVWTDVDNTYPNDRIPQLVDEYIKGQYDQLVGARDKEKGTLYILRVPSKWFIRKLACILAGRNIPDLNSGFRVFDRRIALKYLYLLPMGFSCVSTITLAFICNGYLVGYYPIPYNKRTGQSKFHPVKDTYEYLIQIIRVITYFNPLRIFLPLGAGLFVLGAASGIYHFSRASTLQESDIIILLFSFIIFSIGMLADLIVTQAKK